MHKWPNDDLRTLRPSDGELLQASSLYFLLAALKFIAPFLLPAAGVLALSLGVLNPLSVADKFGTESRGPTPPPSAVQLWLAQTWLALLLPLLRARW